MSNFKKAWDEAWKRSERKQWVYAKMGKINPDGSYTFDVPGKATFVYVTLRSDSSTGGQTIVAARNDAGVEHAPRLNIKMRLEQGIYVIYGRTGREDLGSNPATPPSGVNSHNHDDLYYEKTDFIDTGGNTDFGNLPIKTLPTGLIDESFLPSVAFTDLTDVPNDYTGATGQAVVVNATEDGLEFVDPAVLGLAYQPLVQNSVPVATVGSASSSSFATKGVRVTPSKNMHVYGICYIGNTTASASYKPYCFTFGGGVVANLITGTVYTVAASGETLTSKRHWLWFTSPIALTAGTEYGFAVGRTDSTDTFILQSETSASYKVPFNNQGAESGFVRIAKANPANGDTVDSATIGDMFMLGFCWSFDDEAVLVYALPADVAGSIDAATEQTTGLNTDRYAITDTGVLKYITGTNLKVFLKTYFDTIYSALLSTFSAKNPPIDADSFVITDSAASNATKRVTGTNVKAYLKTYFDTIYSALLSTYSAKNPPIDADSFVITDSAASDVTKRVTGTNLKSYLKTYFDTLYDLTSTAINSLSAKNPPIDADSFVISDSAASGVGKKVTGTNVKAYLKTYFDTIYSALLSTYSAKNPPVDADSFVITDSAASDVTKRVTGTNLKSYLKSYFDSLYTAIGPMGGLSYTYSTTTTDSDPGSGTLRFNNATFASITRIYIDDLDSGANDVQTWTDSWDDSTSSIRGFLIIRKATDASVYRIFSITAAITDASGYSKITVAPIISNGSLSNADSIFVDFIRNGDKGDTGATGSTGSTGATGADSTPFQFNTSTSAADPGSGYIALNNASPPSATQLYMDDHSRGGANNITAWIGALDDSTSEVKGTIRILLDGFPFTQFAVYSLLSVTANSGYYTLSIAWVDGSSLPTFASNDNVTVTFSRTGDRGSGDNGQIFTYSSSTTDSDPGAGNLRFNNATFASITQLFIDDLNYAGTDVQAWLNSLDDNASSTRGHLKVSQLSDQTVWAVFAITGANTDPGGYTKIAVTPVANAGSFTSGQEVSVAFALSGVDASVGSAINAASTDDTVDDTDTFGYTTGSTLKKTAWSNLKSLIKSYYDTLTTTMTNKTLTTPTIGDLTNAQHDHSNAAGGGQFGNLTITGRMVAPNYRSFAVTTADDVCSDTAFTGQGFIYICTQNGSPANRYFVGVFRANSTPTITTLSAGSDVDTSTSTLSNASGTDGRVTIGITNGHIYISNRLGSTATWNVMLIDA